MEFVFSFLIFLIAMLGMSIGIRRRSLQGSCGGLNNIPGLNSHCNGQCRRTCEKHTAQNHSARE